MSATMTDHEKNARDAAYVRERTIARRRANQ
jgi:hypothetical protein